MPTGATFAGGATVGIVDAEGVGTIFAPQEPPAVSINDVEVTEGGTAMFTLRLSASTEVAVVVSFNTGDGTATAPDDYIATIGGTVTIPAGQTSTTIAVATNPDGDDFEGPETFFVDITGATFVDITGATVGIVDAEGVGTIFDPQEPPAVSINDVEVTETGTASFTVRLSAPAADDVVISFNTRDGLARARGGGDAFVAKLIDTDGVITLGYSTYLGGSSSDRGTGVAIDGDGNAYVVGETGSADFPTTANVFQPERTISTVEGLVLTSTDVFVAKIDNSGSALLYSTFLGSGASDFGRAIAVDERGFAYLGGQFGRTDFPDLTLTPFPLKDPIQAEFGGGNGDAFVAVLDLKVNDLLKDPPDDPADDLIFSTYLGGSGSSTEMVWAIALDGDGNIFVTGQTSSLDFPITDGALQTKLNKHTNRGPKDTGSGRSDAFIVKIDINAVAPPPDDDGGGKGGGKPCNPKKEAC